MKKIIILMVIGIFFLWGCGTKKEIKNSYTIAIDSGGESPSNYIDKETGEIAGFEADLMREIAKRGNFKIDFIEKSFSLIISGVRDGKTDMGVGFISIRDERKKILNFSEPYMETAVVLLANKKNKMASNDGKIYAIAKGTYFKLLIEDKKDIEIVEEVDTNKIIEKLVSKEVDYAITSREIAAIYSEKYPEIYEAKVLQEDLVAIAFYKNISPDFIKEVDKIILEMKADGSLDTLKKKYGI